MAELLWVLLGVMLGGTISWLVAHEYARRQEFIKQQNEVSVSGILDFPIEQVWCFISDPFRFKNYTLYDVAQKDTMKTSVRAGAAFRSSHMVSTVYIVDYQFERLLSFGPSPNTWEHYLYLSERGDKTEVFLSRRFRVQETDQSWWQSIMERLFPASSATTLELAFDTLQRIESALESDSKLGH